MRLDCKSVHPGSIPGVASNINWFRLRSAPCKLSLNGRLSRINLLLSVPAPILRYTARPLWVRT